MKDNLKNLTKTDSEKTNAMTTLELVFVITGVVLLGAISLYHIDKGNMQKVQIQSLQTELAQVKSQSSTKSKIIDEMRHQCVSQTDSTLYPLDN